MQFHCEAKVKMIRQWLQVGYQEIDTHDLPSVMSVEDMMLLWKRACRKAMPRRMPSIGAGCAVCMVEWLPAGSGRLVKTGKLLFGQHHVLPCLGLVRQIA
jgi:hypothetical protein